MRHSSTCTSLVRALFEISLPLSLTKPSKMNETKPDQTTPNPSKLNKTATVNYAGQNQTNYRTQKTFQ
jgi:hypothetical protein